MEMRGNLKTYLDQGGNVANLAGNTSWWLIEYKNNNRSIQIYPKSSVGYQWHRTIDNTNTPYSPGSIKNQLGCGFENGGASLPTKNLNSAHGWTWSGIDATVFNGDHWLYDGSGVANGALFGKSLGIADYEVDGLSLLKDKSGKFVMDMNGTPVVAPNTMTPANFEILATTDITTLKWDRPWNRDKTNNWNWTVGFYRTAAGGMVFNAATVQWGLAFTPVECTKATQNPAIHLTRNFLRASIAGTMLYEVKKSYLPENTSDFTYTYQISPNALVGWVLTKSALLLPNMNDEGAVPLYLFRETKSIRPNPNKPAAIIIREQLSTNRNLLKPSKDLTVITIGHAFLQAGVGRRPVYAFNVKRSEGNTFRFSTRNTKLHTDETEGVIRFYVR